MKKLLVLSVILLAGCTARPRAATPQFAGIIRQAGDVTKTVDLAQSDSKEVKKALRAAQDSNVLLRRLNSEARTILDRQDYKTRALLEGTE